MLNQAKEKNCLFLSERPGEMMGPVIFFETKSELKKY